MPSWDDYKKTAKSRGALALELSVIESTPAGDAELVRATLPDHLAYQKERKARASLVLAGPMSGESGNTMEVSG